MPRPHSDIPSQRLTVGRSQAVNAAAPQRSIWWTIAITIAGWVLLGYPIALLAVLSLVIMTGSLDTTVTVAAVALGIVGFLTTLSMVAFPVLLGMAVKVRRRSLWVPALLTGVVTIAACIYLIFEWMIPFG